MGLMDLAPTLEEMYGSARFFFIFMLTGICGYLASSTFGHFSVGASGSLAGHDWRAAGGHQRAENMGAKMLRSQLIYWLIYIAVMGFIMPGVDNYRTHRRIRFRLFDRQAHGRSPAG